MKNNGNNSIFDLIYVNKSGSGSTTPINASDVTNDSNVSGTTVADALNALLVGAGLISFKREVFTSIQGQEEFILLSIPVENSEVVDVNGLKAYPGIDYDYIITDNKVTFNEGLPVGYKIMITYI